MLLMTCEILAAAALSLSLALALSDMIALLLWLLLRQIFQLANSPDTDLEVRSEAHWVVLNATSCGSDTQIEYLVLQGCVPILSDLLGENSMVSE